MTQMRYHMTARAGLSSGRPARELDEALVGLHARQPHEMKEFVLEKTMARMQRAVKVRLEADTAITADSPTLAMTTITAVILYGGLRWGRYGAERMTSAAVFAKQAKEQTYFLETDRP